MIAKSWLSLFLFILALPISTHATSIQGGNQNRCQKEPSYRCLKQFIDGEVKKLKSKHKDTNIIRFHWQFESRTGLDTVNFNDLHQQLLAEETFLRQLKLENSQQINNPTTKLQDASALLPSLLLIEQFTLNLKDQKADTIKRHLLSTSLTPPNLGQLDKLVIETARAEITAGAVEKGLYTLSTAQVDAFSDTILFYEKQFSTALANLSRNLFLDPSFQLSRCNGTQPVTAAINALLSGYNLTPLESIAHIPDTTVQTKLKLDLLRTHKNAQSCPLFITMLMHYFIQEEIQLYNSKQKSLLSLIYFYRALRRHIL